jgi:hypothetical protein
LDHDGVLAAGVLPQGEHELSVSHFFENEENYHPSLKKGPDVLLKKEEILEWSHEICQILSNGDFKEWSQYLLAEPVEIVAKRVIVNGSEIELS